MSISSDLVDNFQIDVGTYFDGEVARKWQVTINVETDHIRIKRESGATEIWAAADIRIATPPQPGKWFSLEHAKRDGARLQLPPRMFDRLLEQFGAPRHPSWLEAMRPSLLPLAAFSVWMGLVALLLVPWLAEQTAKLHSPDTLAQAGQQSIQTYLTRMDKRRRHGVQYCNETQGLQALQKLSNLLGGLPGQSFEPKVLVIDSSRINAASFGAGYVLLNSALLDFVTNETELLGVMAHEMGHAEGRHSVREEIEVVWTVTLGNMLLHTAAGGYGYVLAGSGVENPFRQRAFEREADHHAVGQLQRAGMDPGASGFLMQRLAEHYGGDLGFFDTHPTYAKRHAFFAAAAQQGYMLLTPKEWQALKAICRTKTKTAPAFLQGPQ